MTRFAWLTPDAQLTPGITCRVLRIPDPFLPYVMGAIGELTHVWSWEESGNLTPEQCADLMGTFYDEIRGCFMIGSVLPFVTASLPDNVLLCDGSTYDRADFPKLYAVLDACYIVDADHFTVPDLVGRSIMGTDTDQGDELGSESVTLTTDNLASHSHTDSGHTHSEITCVLEVADVGIEIPIPVGMPGLGATGVGYAAISSTGGDESFSVVRPVHLMRYGVIAW